MFKENKQFQEEKYNKSFDLGDFEGVVEILEKTEKEFERRKLILKKALENLSIDEEKNILAPALFERTDLGHSFDIEFIFLGDISEQLKLEIELDKYNISVSIILFDEKEVDLDEIEDNFPEFLELINKNKNNIDVNESLIDESDIYSDKYWDIAQELESNVRDMLTLKEKTTLQSERIKLGEKFIDEINEKISVISYNFFGSTVSNIDKFSLSSDLDVSVLIDIESDEGEQNAFLLIRVYLKWKYMEKYGVEIDCHFITIKSLNELKNRTPKLYKKYKKEFNLE